MGDDVLASLRPEGGWTAAPVEKPAQRAVTPAPVVQRPEATQVTGAAEVDDERWLLACVDRGHVRWHGDGPRRVATRSCAHSDHETDVTDAVAPLSAAGWAQRAGSPGASHGAVTLTTEGRRRLAQLERDAHG